MTPGVTRMSTRWRRPRAEASRSSRAISSRLSTMIGADAGVERLAHLARVLVVAVHVDPLRREAGPQGGEQLAARGHVHAEALLARQAQHRLAEVGLAGVDDVDVGRERGEGLAVGAGDRAQGALVVDDEGGAVLLGELHEVAPADRQVALGSDRCGGGQHLFERHHRRAGRYQIPLDILLACRGPPPSPCTPPGGPALAGLLWAAPAGAPGVVIVPGFGSRKENHADFAEARRRRGDGRPGARPARPRRRAAARWTAT